MPYEVLKRHVPPGARVADCAPEQLYLGDDGPSAHATATLARREALAHRESTGIGTLCIDVHGPAGEVWFWSWNRITEDGSATVDGGVARSPGYPAHACGSPMSPPAAVPPIVAAQLAGPAGVRLYCAGCCAWVNATADERLRALNAWAAEKGAQ